MVSRALSFLLRLLLVASAYGLEFAVFWQYPLPDRLFAIIPGTLLALLLVLIRKNQILGVLSVAGMSLLGIVISFVLFVPSIGNGWGRPRLEIMAATWGAAAGGIFALLYRERHHK